MTQDFDVIVIGGGVAGLGGALMLSRARRSVLVIDAGSPRNLPADHTHGFLTRDGSTPLEMTALGAAEVRSYGNEVVSGEVRSIEAVDGGYRVSTPDRSWTARRLLVTTGLVDELPALPGLAELWGRDVVHCPYCFGWEVRDQPIGVLGTSAHSVVQALMWRQWSEDIVLFQHTGPAPTAEERERLDARGIRVVEGEVTGLEVSEGRLAGVIVDEVVPRRVLVVSPSYVSRHALLAPLGVQLIDHPRGIGRQVAADAMGMTAARGVWVAGNALDVAAGILQSAASGATAGVAINADLIEADTVCAVAEASWSTAEARG
jgi:thioredoxin reductase